MSKDCEVIKDLIPLYVDEVCSMDSKSLVEKHLESCDECKKIAEQMKERIELPLDNGNDVKGFKQFINKKIWAKALAVIVVFAILWTAGNLLVTLHFSEIWPKIDAEGVNEMLSVVDINGTLYLHQKDLLGRGQIIVTSDEDLEQGIIKFYLGEQGLTSLDPRGMLRMFYCADTYQQIPNQYTEESGFPPTKKIVYCHKDGTEVVTLWQEGDNILTLK